jgi:hypothetical protein
MPYPIVIIGSGLALLLTILFIWWLTLRVAPGGQKLTMKQVNRRALGTLIAILVGLPIIWAISVAVIAGLATLPPFGHLLLWGSIAVLAILLGAFAIIRKAILRGVAQ